MPIIKAKNKPEKKQIRVSVEASTLDNITAYCELFNIKKPDDFFEQAAQYILSKDKDWQNHLSEKEQS